jgi:hypothetical protein
MGVGRRGGGGKEMKWRRFSWNSKERSCDTCQKAGGLGDVLLPRRPADFGFLSAITEGSNNGYLQVLCRRFFGTDVIAVTEGSITGICKCCVDGSLVLMLLQLLKGV